MTRQEAEQRAKEIERSLGFNENGESVKDTCEIIADALIEGYENAMSQVKEHIKEKWEHCSFKSGSTVCDELLYELFEEDKK